MSSFLRVGPNLILCLGISLPCGFARIDSEQPRNNRGSRTLSELPIGLQLLGKALEEVHFANRPRLRAKHGLAQSAAGAVGRLCQTPNLGYRFTETAYKGLHSKQRPVVG